jgi:fatty acyl-CoA reductase
LTTVSPFKFKLFAFLQLFDVLKRCNSSNLKKIVPVLGDCKELSLGLSPSDRELLEQTVSVVFHCAATIRFDFPLTSAVILNVRGTREVMLLAKNMKQLKVCPVTFYVKY